MVPIVPYNLIHHLAAPIPYICGVLSRYTQHVLAVPGGIGIVLMVDLDKNQMQVFGTSSTATGTGTGTDTADTQFPDLLRPILVDDRYVQQATAVVIPAPAISGGGSTSTNLSSTGGGGGATLGGVQGQHTQYQPEINGYGGGGGGGSSSSGYGYGYGGSTTATSSNVPQVTLSECLASDMMNTLKQDQSLWAFTTGASGKAADAVVESLGKTVGGIKNFFGKTKKSLNRSSSSVMANSTSTLQQPDYSEEMEDDIATSEEQRRVQETLDGFWDGEFAYNARAEEELRVAITSFFVCLLGDYSTYLSKDPKQTNVNVPVLDRVKFMEQRKLRGDYEGTPMYVVLTHFVQSQMLEQFAHERIAYIMSQDQQQQGNVADTAGRSMFELAVEHIRRSKLEYSLGTVKQVIRQISSSSPHSKTINNAQLARERTLVLTSKNGYNESSRSNPATDLAQLTEACRAIPEVRLATMSVVWTRIKDSKGLQSKHAFLALLVLRNLILHGPITSVTDAAEYLHVIRVLKVYQSRLSPANAKDIRTRAAEVYELLVDRSKLFAQRRYCANRRRELSGKARKVQLRREPRFERGAWVRAKFLQIHEVLKPGGAAATVASAKVSGETRYYWYCYSVLKICLLPF